MTKRLGFGTLQPELRNKGFTLYSCTLKNTEIINCLEDTQMNPKYFSFNYTLIGILHTFYTFYCSLKLRKIVAQTSKHVTSSIQHMYLISIIEWLFSNFEMKDMGDAEFILNVKIQHHRAKRMLSLSQKSYINKIFEQLDMLTQ